MHDESVSDRQVSLRHARFFRAADRQSIASFVFRKAKQVLLGQLCDCVFQFCDGFRAGFFDLYGAGYVVCIVAE